MEQTPKADWKVILAILLCGLVFAFSQNQNYKRSQEIARAKARTAAVASSNGALAMTSPAGTSAMVTGTGSHAAFASATPSLKKVAEKVTLSNKVLDLTISSAGARPIAADLKQYKSSIDSTQDAGLVQLVATSNEGIAPLQAWFGDLTTSVIPIDAPFEKVREAANEAEFRYHGADGLTLTRTFATAEDEYLVSLTEEFKNEGTTVITGHPGLVWSANFRNASSRSSPVGEFGALSRVNNRTQRGNPSKPGDRSWLVFPASEFEYRYGGPVQWVGIDDRYFVAAAVPIDPPFDAPENVRFFHPGLHSIAALAIGPETKLEPGASRVFKYQLYLGPKDYQVLQKGGHELGDTIYWGRYPLEPISKGFWHFLRWLHGILGNWGWSIIVLTLIVRGALSPLAAKQMKSSQEFAAKSSRLKPQLDRLKEKFADDPMKLNTETMALYKTHGLSPFSPVIGCLPMLAQLPVWWALYKVLWGSIDLRQQPFAFWIHDLAAPDPYKILPVLLGAVTFVQTKLTPQAPGTDASQQKMMLYTMPLLFTFMMLYLPSGLVLYIFTSTVMNIGQQYYLRRKYPMNPPPKSPVVAAQSEAT